MAYPPPLPGPPPNLPPPGPYGPPQPQDTSGRLLKLSGATLIWVVAGVILLCVVGPVVLCLLCGVGGIMGGVVPGPTPTGYP